MPLIKIYLKKREGVDKPKIAQTMRTIMHEMVKAPVDDGPVQFFEFSDEDWFMPPGWPETKTFVEILMFPGRKRETKQRLLFEIATQLSQLLHIDKTDVLITLHEPGLDNWGIAGGQQASQIGVGFKLDV